MVMSVTHSCMSRKRCLASAVCRAGSAFPPSESVLRRQLFSQMEVTSCCCLCEQGITHKEKAFERIRWKCLRKKREKSENHILCLQND